MMPTLYEISNVIKFRTSVLIVTLSVHRVPAEKANQGGIVHPEVIASLHQFLRDVIFFPDVGPTAVVGRPMFKRLVHAMVGETISDLFHPDILQGIVAASQRDPYFRGEKFRHDHDPFCLCGKNLGKGGRETNPGEMQAVAGQYQVIASEGPARHLLPWPPVDFYAMGGIFTRLFSEKMPHSRRRFQRGDFASHVRKGPGKNPVSSSDIEHLPRWLR